jgi:hypothetical protein
MKRCEALKGDGARCRARATQGSNWCYNHDPTKAEERKANARRGGKAGGNGRAREATKDVVEARAYTKGLISRLLKGELPTPTAAVAFQGINALMRVVEMERKIIEQDELEERLGALERRARVEQQRSSWPRAGHRR